MRAALKRARLKAGKSIREVSRDLGRSDNFAHRVETGERMLDACEFVDYARAVQSHPLEIMAEMMKHGHGSSQE